MSNRRAELVTMSPSKKPELTHLGYQAGHAHDRAGVPVNESAFRAICRHIVRSQLRALRGIRFQIFQGKPGVGKSEALRITCSRLGVPLIMVAAAELSGETEGASVEVMRHLELVGRTYAERDNAVPVFCFEDFDTSIVARRPGVEYTVNSQLLESYFQFIADTDGFTTSTGERMPIFMTGNDFSDMRSPLLRPGRAEFFTFAPNLEEKTAIVASMFPGADDKAIKALVKAHANEPVAFFHGLQVGLLNDTIDALMASHRFDITAVVGALTEHRPVIDMAQVKLLAAQAATAKAGSFLNLGGA